MQNILFLALVVFIGLCCCFLFFSMEKTAKSAKDERLLSRLFEPKVNGLLYSFRDDI